MGLSRSLPLTCAALLIFGLSSYPLGGAHSAAIWMSQVPRELQGRVFSVRRVVGQSSIPLGVVAALAIVFALLSGQVRRVEDKAYLDELAAQAL